MRHDVMFFSSLFEGFGLVLPEAVPCRASAIRTPHEAAPDSVSEDDSTARIRDVEVMEKNHCQAIAIRLPPRDKRRWARRHSTHGRTAARAVRIACRKHLQKTRLLHTRAFAGALTFNCASYVES